LGLQFQISAPGRHPFQFANDFIRAIAWPRRDSDFPSRQKFAADQCCSLSNRAWLVHRALCRRLGKSVEMVAHYPDDYFVYCFRDRDFRRNESVAVRSARSRAGARWRLQHGVQLDEVRAFFSRGIRGHDHWISCHGDFVLRRLAFSWNPRRLTWVDLWTVKHRRVFRESWDTHLPVHVGPLDVAAFSLRSTHAAGLALLLRNCAREHLYCRGNPDLDPRMTRITPMIFNIALIDFSRQF